MPSLGGCGTSVSLFGFSADVSMLIVPGPVQLMRRREKINLLACAGATIFLAEFLGLPSGSFSKVGQREKKRNHEFHGGVEGRGGGEGRTRIVGSVGLRCG